MQFENVHSIRIFYDDVRSGTADFRGAPHYFEALFDNVADDWTEYFRLYPVTVEFMERELRLWTISQTWWTKFHRGLVPLDTQPDRRGNVPEYDKLDDWLNQHIKKLEPLATCFTAVFRTRTGQDNLPLGILRELEVAWRSTAA